MQSPVSGHNEPPESAPEIAATMPEFGVETGLGGDEPGGGMAVEGRADDRAPQSPAANSRELRAARRSFGRGVEALNAICKRHRLTLANPFHRAIALRLFRKRRGVGKG
jgi:hypothetical protein